MIETTRHFATVAGRRVHYTRAGTGPAVLLLHESPCSARSMATPQQAFAERFTAIAPDTPGFGLSDPLPLPLPEIPDFADALAALLDVLGIEQAAVYGRHTGASIAAAFAHRHPDRCAMLLTAGLPVYSTAQRESRLTDYLKPLTPSWDGTHLLWLWFRYREQHVFWPWHDQRAERRADRDVPSLDFLQRGVLEFLEAGDGYRIAYAAAFRHGGQVLDLLPQLRVPACLAAHEGDSLFRTLALFPAGTWTAALPQDEALAAAAERDLLSAHPARFTVPPAPPPQPLPGRTHLDLPTIGGRQTLLRTAHPNVGPFDDPPGDPTDAPTPLLLLHHVPGSSALYDDALLAFGQHRRAIALDLPGCGESAPAPTRSTSPSTSPPGPPTPSSPWTISAFPAPTSTAMVAAPPSPSNSPPRRPTASPPSSSTAPPPSPPPSATTSPPATPPRSTRSGTAAI